MNSDPGLRRLPASCTEKNSKYRFLEFSAAKVQPKLNFFFLET